MSQKRNVKIAATVMTSALLLSGCGLFGGEKAKEIDPPQDVSYVDEGDKAAEETVNEEKTTAEGEKGEESGQTYSRQLYLIDSNGLVVAQTFDLPKQEGVAKQVLDYLVEGGPVTNMLPDGFRAVIPQDTQVSVNVKDGVALVDFSKEFKNYQKEDELKILQSITWTLTQFDSVKTVKIMINGHEQNEMPVGGTPISSELSRADGINLDTAGVMDITDTKPLTVYYTAQHDDKTYYVPVTTRVSNDEEDPISAVVKKLTEGPSADTALLSDFSQDVKLLEEPKLEDGTVTLNFNESIYGSADEEKKMVSSHIVNSLVLSLTEQPGIENVVLTVDGKADLVNEDGKKMTEPVARPVNVNTGSF
ncbi:GerMN domain-containing protein [Metabacillus sp. JX24]|uniref:GerMN domain-containing protein n=1 Tax=Metabacillus sp. JX24 TaxID=3240759 RepID=UPI00350F864A